MGLGTSTAATGDLLADMCILGAEYILLSLHVFRACFDPNAKTLLAIEMDVTYDKVKV